MTPDQVSRMKQAARTLLAHHEAGRKCDPHAVDWAKFVTRKDWPQCAQQQRKDAS